MSEDRSDVLGVSRLDGPYEDNEAAQNQKTDLPMTPTEIKLLSIWQPVLPAVQIQRTDHFIELGGDSLALAQVITEVEETYAIHLSVEMVANNLTLGSLAAVIDRLVTEKEQGET